MIWQGCLMAPIVPGCGWGHSCFSALRSRALSGLGLRRGARGILTAFVPPGEDFARIHQAWQQLASQGHTVVAEEGAAWPNLSKSQADATRKDINGAASRPV